jgi:hypothetical protein
VAAAEEEWALRADDIRAGRRQHVWDLFNERGFIKDVAGYVFFFRVRIVRRALFQTLLNT